MVPAPRFHRRPLSSAFSGAIRVARRSHLEDVGGARELHCRLLYHPFDARRRYSTRLNLNSPNSNALANGLLRIAFSIEPAVLFIDERFELFAVLVEPTLESIVAAREDLNREEARVLCVIDGHGGDGNAGRHLAD